MTREASPACGSPSTTSPGTAGIAPPPTPFFMGAGLIKNSDHLRIGQCGTILPDWHPLRVAEDIALLDNFTDGRVDFGIARGFDTRASAQFSSAGRPAQPQAQLRVLQRGP